MKIKDQETKLNTHKNTYSWELRYSVLLRSKWW
jgi:hypothetical protein